VPEIVILEPHIRGGTFAPGLSQLEVRHRLAHIGVQSDALEYLYGWHNGFAPATGNVLPPELFGMAFEPLDAAIELFQTLRSIDAELPGNESFFGSPTWFPIFRFVDFGIVLLDTATDLDLHLHDRDYGVSEDSITAAKFFQALVKRANRQSTREEMDVPDSWLSCFTNETP
jgi:hypothetical protein